MRAHHHAARNAAFSSSAAAIESDLLHSLKHPPRIGVLQDGKEVDGDSHPRDLSDPMEKAMPRIAVPPSFSSSDESKPHSSSGRRMHTKTHTRTTKTAAGRPSAAYRGSGSKSSGVIDSDDKLRRVIEDGAGVSLNADGFLEPIFGKGATFQGSLFHRTSQTAHHSLHSSGLHASSSRSLSINSPGTTHSTHASSKSSPSPSLQKAAPSAAPATRKLQQDNNGDNNNGDGELNTISVHMPHVITLGSPSSTSPLSSSSSSKATSTGLPPGVHVLGDNPALNGNGRSAAKKIKEKGGLLPKDQMVVSNNPNYGFAEAQEDLFTVRRQAGDLDQLVSKEKRNETLLALFDAAARYFPEVDTKKVIRTYLADIRAESDFQEGNVSGGRLDSGKSVGLVQVSPGGQSNELDTFKKNARTDANTYSWSAGSGTDREVKEGGHTVLGPLLDFDTGKEMELHKLTKKDITRPWVNIHVALWIQSNNARTGSQDPSKWPKIAKASREVREAYQSFAREHASNVNADSGAGSQAGSQAGANGDGSSASSSSSSSSSSNSGSVKEYAHKLKKLEKALDGKNKQPRNMATALGSWVAGTADNDGGYETQGDDASRAYLKQVGKSIATLYGAKPTMHSKYGKEWLSELKLTAGLVDYRL